MNWLVIGILSLVLGPVLILAGAKHERKNNEPPQLVQYGYLLAVVGLFILLVQFFSISAAMLIFVVLTGVVWAMDKLVWGKTRGDQQVADWVEYARGFFPVILAVFVLRSFIVEPFQIPSSSMRPGLVVGDFILVNKFAYGLRLPILNKVVVPVGEPQHGDVMVFDYPNNPKIQYIKRVIGLPGDVVEYQGKKLTVNGQVVKTTADGEHQYVENGVYLVNNQQFIEQQGGKQYKTLNMAEVPALNLREVADFPFRENCSYDESGFKCTVPEGQYFTMGDNRDHSADSRYWGFVPSDHIVGKAFFVWMNFKHFDRIGTAIK
ncbi:signal peptidase I [uncultured Deefgea sp.]|uniref:signal peptidase I n=1 Tax=uncultured Deefgea sp. TaxID=1304914 RepID=UPI00259518AA|nr:signal peptidase I [uncultured Deefgea sp.]